MSTSSLSDAELLDRFSRERDDDAFAELVRRHIGWVHSTAVRLMFGDDFAAEEVTQDVFTDLARKSTSLAREVRGGKPLAGWLHSGTRLAASNYRRAISRRIARELHEGERNQIDPMNHDTANSAGWEEIRPLIDQALAELQTSDRDAVLMRFFEEKDMRSIGNALGVSEDAARKRVDRALDRLRDWLGSRGVRTTAAALISAVTAHGIVPPPAGLSERIASKALLSHGGVAASLHSRWNLIAAVGTVLVGLIVWGTYQGSRAPKQSMTEVGSVQDVEPVVFKTQSTPAANTAGAASVDGSKSLNTVRIPKVFLDRASFASVVMTSANDRRFVPSRQFIEIFRLTAGEVKDVVAALDEALYKYRTIEGQRLVPTTPPDPRPFALPPRPDTSESRIVVLEKRHFALKPFPEESQAIHKELEASVLSILGAQRGAAFIRMGEALKGEMKTFETTQMFQGHIAQMAIETLYTYRLVQLDQGPIVDLERASSPGNFYGSPYGEELYQYVPEGLKADLARWREYIRKKGSTYFEWAATMRDSMQDSQIGSSEIFRNLKPWDDESLTVEIPMERLSTLSIAGLTPVEAISEDAVELCGLTEAEVALASKIHENIKERFLELERGHFERVSTNSLEFVLHAFPRENAALQLEFARSLRSLLGDERGEMLYALIRTPMSKRNIYAWMQKSVDFQRQNEFLSEISRKRWLDRGDHEIQLKLVQMGADWRVEHRSVTDPNDVGAATLNWSRVPMRWRHLLTRDLVEPPAPNNHK
jgi:RNA polymerase sigma factor (sigma-70 family)